MQIDKKDMVLYAQEKIRDIEVDSPVYESILIDIAQTFECSVEQVIDALRPGFFPAKAFPLEAIAPSGWLHDIVRVYSQTSTPDAYWFFGAAAILGSALGRNAMVDRGVYQVYAPGSVLFTGGPGETKKTTCINRLRALGTAAEVVTFLPEDLTPEKLVDELIQNPTAIWPMEELTRSVSGKYREHLPGLLNTLLDHPVDYRTGRVVAGDKCINKPTLTVLAGSNLRYLTQLPGALRDGGFASRLLCVHQDRGKQISQPKVLQSEVDECVIQLRALSRISGVYTLSSDAEAHFTKEDEYARSKTLYRDAYWTRRDQHMLRLAMLLHISSGMPTTEISLDTLRQASRALYFIEYTMGEPLSALVADPASRAAAQVIRELRKRGSVYFEKFIISNAKAELDDPEAARRIPEAIELLCAKQIIYRSISRGMRVLTLRRIQ